MVEEKIGVELHLNDVQFNKQLDADEKRLDALSKKVISPNVGRPKIGTDINISMYLDQFRNQVNKTSNRLTEKARDAGITMEKAFDAMEPELQRGFNSLEQVFNTLSGWEKKLVRINADATVPPKPGQNLAGGSVSRIKLDTAKQAFEGDFNTAKTAFNVLQTTIRELTATIAGENTKIQTAKRAEAEYNKARAEGRKAMAQAFEDVVKKQMPGKEFAAARREASDVYKGVSPYEKTLMAKKAGFIPGGLNSADSVALKETLQGFRPAFNKLYDDVITIGKKFAKEARLAAPEANKPIPKPTPVAIKEIKTPQSESSASKPSIYNSPDSYGGGGGGKKPPKKPKTQIPYDEDDEEYGGVEKIGKPKLAKHQQLKKKAKELSKEVKDKVQVINTVNEQLDKDTKDVADTIKTNITSAGSGIDRSKFKPIKAKAESTTTSSPFTPAAKTSIDNATQAVKENTAALKDVGKKATEEPAGRMGTGIRNTAGKELSDDEVPALLSKIGISSSIAAGERTKQITPDTSRAIKPSDVMSEAGRKLLPVDLNKQWNAIISAGNFATTESNLIRLSSAIGRVRNLYKEARDEGKDAQAVAIERTKNEISGLQELEKVVSIVKGQYATLTKDTGTIRERIDKKARTDAVEADEKIGAFPTAKLPLGYKKPAYSGHMDPRFLTDAKTAEEKIKALDIALKDLNNRNAYALDLHKQLRAATPGTKEYDDIIRKTVALKEYNKTLLKWSAEVLKFQKAGSIDKFSSEAQATPQLRKLADAFRSGDIERLSPWNTAKVVKQRPTGELSITGKGEKALAKTGNEVNKLVYGLEKGMRAVSQETMFDIIAKKAEALPKRLMVSGKTIADYLGNVKTARPIDPAEEEKLAQRAPEKKAKDDQRRIALAKNTLKSSFKDIKAGGLTEELADNILRSIQVLDELGYAWRKPLAAAKKYEDLIKAIASKSKARGTGLQDDKSDAFAAANRKSLTPEQAKQNEAYAKLMAGVTPAKGSNKIFGTYVEDAGKVKKLMSTMNDDVGLVTGKTRDWAVVLKEVVAIVNSIRIDADVKKANVNVRLFAAALQEAASNAAKVQYALSTGKIQAGTKQAKDALNLVLEQFERVQAGARAGAKVPANANAVDPFKQIEAVAGKAALKIKEVGAVSKDLSKSEKYIAPIVKQMNAATSATNGFVKSISRVTSGILISQGFYKLMFAVQAGVGAVKDYMLDMEQAQVSMAIMLGNSQSAARGFLFEIRKLAIDYGQDVQTTISNSKLLMAFGFSARQTLSMLPAMIDMAAIRQDATVVDKLTRALGQIQAAGVLRGTELKKLYMAGVPIVSILNKHLGTTGKTIAEIGRMNISAAHAIPVIIKGIEDRFPGAAKALANTVRGLITQIASNLKLVSDALLQPVFGIVKDLLRGHVEQIKAAMSGVSVAMVMDATRKLPAAMAGMSEPMVAAAKSFMSTGLLGYIVSLRDALEGFGAGGLFEKLVPDKDMQNQIRTIVGWLELLVHQFKSIGAWAKENLKGFGELLIGGLQVVIPILMAVITPLLQVMKAFRAGNPLVRAFVYGLLGLLAARGVTIVLASIFGGLKVGGGILGFVGKQIGNVVRGFTLMFQVLKGGKDAATGLTAVTFGMTRFVSVAVLVIGIAFGVLMAFKRTRDAILGFFGSIQKFFLGIDINKILQPIKQAAPKVGDYTGPIEDATDELTADATAADAAAKKFVAAFDEVYQVPENDPAATETKTPEIPDLKLEEPTLALEDTAQKWSKIWDAIKDHIKDVLMGILMLLGRTLMSCWRVALTWMKQIATTVEGFFAVVGEITKLWLSTLGEVIANWWKGILEKQKIAWTAVGKIIVIFFGWLGDMCVAIGHWFKAVGTTIADFFTTVWGIINGAWQGILQISFNFGAYIGKIISSALSLLVDEFHSSIALIQDICTTGFGAIGKIVMEVMNFIANPSIAAFKSMTSNIGGIVDDWVKGTAGKITGFVSNSKDSWTKFGSDAATGLSDFKSSSKGIFDTWVTDSANSIGTFKENTKNKFATVKEEFVNGTAAANLAISDIISKANSDIAAVDADTFKKSEEAWAQFHNTSTGLWKNYQDVNTEQWKKFHQDIGQIWLENKIDLLNLTETAISGIVAKFDDGSGSLIKSVKDYFTGAKDAAVESQIGQEVLSGMVPTEYETTKAGTKIGDTLYMGAKASALQGAAEVASAAAKALSDAASKETWFLPTGQMNSPEAMAAAENAGVMIGGTYVSGISTGISTEALNNVASKIPAAMAGMSVPMTNAGKSLGNATINGVNASIAGYKPIISLKMIADFSIFNQQMQAFSGNQAALKSYTGATKSSGTQFATGGIVERATLATIGEKGKEAVVPLTAEALTPWAQAIVNQMALNGGSMGSTDAEYVAVKIKTSDLVDLERQLFMVRKDETARVAGRR